MPKPTHDIPTKGSSDFTIVAESDIGYSANKNMLGVQALIAEKSPRFVLAPGDLAYGDQDGPSAINSHFNDMMLWSQDAAYMAIWGNHDWEVLTTNGQPVLNEFEGRFTLPNAQTVAGAETAPGHQSNDDWYWFDYGNVRFIAYPEPYTNATWADWSSKAKLLMDTAQTDNNITFIVSFGHRPAYSSGHHPGDSALKTILDHLGATHNKYVLNINGHSHDYERSFPQQGVVHLTVGTGGRSLETDGSCLWLSCTQPDWSDFRILQHGYTELHFTKTAITGAFICGPTESDKNDTTCNTGQVTDSFSILPKPTTDSLACIFNYIEAKYPQYYAPANNKLLVYGSNSYRYYTATDSLLAYSPTDDHLYGGYSYSGKYYYFDGGPLTAWKSTAGC